MTKRALSRNFNINKLSLTQSLNNFQTREEKLFGNKSFLEIILGLIKKTQIDVLGNNKLTKNSFNFSAIKQTLIGLKNDLSMINKEKEKTVKFLQKIKKDKEINIKGVIYKHSKSKSFANTGKNNFIPNPETLIIENEDDESMKEISQLKYLNFRVENEIKKVDNLVHRLNFEKDYLNMARFINQSEVDTIYYIKQSNNESVNEILHDKLIRIRKNFIKRANIKNNQDIHINRILGKISQCKQDLKDLYDENNIISEEEKSYIDSIIENYKKNNDNENDNDDESSINDDEDNNSSFESEDKDGVNNLHKNDKIINFSDVKEDSNKKIRGNLSHKDSTNNEDTCCNSCEKNQLEVQNYS